MSGDAPAVTVLLPIWDAEAYLGEALDSVRAQTFDDFEVLVVDDGSRDGGPDLVRACPDARVRLSSLGENRGLVAALNAGLVQARGRYIARMDADDVCLPTRLAEQVEHLDAYPTLGGVSSAFETIDGNGRVLGIVDGRHRPVGPALLRWALHFGSFFCHPAAMLRREVFDAVGSYDADFSPAEDYDLWLRGVEKFPLDNLPRQLLRLRWHGDNVSLRQRATQQANARRALARTLRGLLCEDVPDAQLRILRDPAPPACARDAIDAAALLRRMERAFASMVDLSPREQQLIRDDTATRLASMSVTAGRRWPMAGARIAGWALHRSPSAAGRALQRRIVQKTGVWNHSPLFAETTP